MWGWLLVAAQAQVALPAYDEALARGTWIALDARLEQTCAFNPHASGVECTNPAVLDEVIARAEAWQRVVQPDAGLAYLAGLAWRYKGDAARAQDAWEQAVALDPGYRAPWYDLGELYLAAGDLDRADHAFTQVGQLTPPGAETWLAPWRLAEVAAFRKDPAAFEGHLREAIRHGFTFDRVGGLPNWKAFLDDPVIGPSVEKLVTVYGNPEQLDAIRRGAP